jgi:hypothetical protein
MEQKSLNSLKENQKRVHLSVYSTTFLNLACIKFHQMSDLTKNEYYVNIHAMLAVDKGGNTSSACCS